MKQPRRLGLEKSATRERIVAAAMKVLQQEGGIGLTASAVARVAEVKPHLIHYYFRTMDDLLVAVVEIAGREGLEKTAASLTSKDPLRALWMAETGSTWGNLILQIQAIAIHRDSVRKALVAHAEKLRTLQIEAVVRHCEERQIVTDIPPVAMIQLIVGIARQLVRERALGFTLGHEVVVSVIEDLLDQAAGRSGDNTMTDLPSDRTISMVEGEPETGLGFQSVAPRI